MKRWTKRLWISAGALLGIAIVAGLVGWILVRGTPEWYQPGALTPDQRAQAARRAETKLTILQNEAARIRAAERASRRRMATTEAALAGDPPASITVSFTDDEINAFFDKWTIWQNVKNSYQKFVLDPCIVVQDGRIILAGRMTEMNAIVTVQFEPRIQDDGRLRLKIVRVLAGRLPLPQSAFAAYKRQAAGAVAQRLPGWRQQAAIDAAGNINGGAISAAMGQLLINVLNEHPAEPVLFLPLVERGTVPVRLSDIKIETHALTLTVQPMTHNQRVELLGRIRQGPSQEE